MAAKNLVDRRYAHDLKEWAAWQQQQARLRHLAGRALDTLEDALEAGGPDALKAAALILRMTATAELRAPQRLTLEMTDAEVLAAGIVETPASTT